MVGPGGRGTRGDGSGNALVLVRANAFAASERNEGGSMSEPMALTGGGPSIVEVAASIAEGLRAKSALAIEALLSLCIVVNFLLLVVVVVVVLVVQVAQVHQFTEQVFFQ
jgi:hypothetical protein